MPGSAHFLPERAHARCDYTCHTFIMPMVVTIHVPLLDEGVDVCRPAQAEALPNGLYRLLGDVPDDERWRFQPGVMVRCANRQLSGDFDRVSYCIVAVEEVGP